MKDAIRLLISLPEPSMVLTLDIRKYCSWKMESWHDLGQCHPATSS